MAFLHKISGYLVDVNEDYFEEDIVTEIEQGKQRGKIRRKTRLCICDRDYGASSATGNCGASSVSDPTGVAVAWGHEAKAKGCLGAHLILSDWRYIGEKWFDGDYKTPYDVESWELAGAKMVQVDGEKIKADTYYRCVDGEVVEADE